MTGFARGGVVAPRPEDGGDSVPALLSGCDYVIPPRLAAEMAAGCARCSGEGWVCESHHGRAWGDMCCDGPRRAARVHWLHRVLPYWGPFRPAWRIRVLCKHGACHCGGAGDPCPSCNPPGRVDWAHVIAETAQ